MGATFNAGTEHAPRGGVAQDVVFVNKEELLMHITAKSSLGCSNCDIVV